MKQLYAVNQTGFGAHRIPVFPIFTPEGMGGVKGCSPFAAQFIDTDVVLLDSAHMLVINTDKIGNITKGSFDEEIVIMFTEPLKPELLVSEGIGAVYDERNSKFMGFASRVR